MDKPRATVKGSGKQQDKGDGYKEGRGNFHNLQGSGEGGREYNPILNFVTQKWSKTD